jgi:hypothetical protein
MARPKRLGLDQRAYLKTERLPLTIADTALATAATTATQNALRASPCWCARSRRCRMMTAQEYRIVRDLSLIYVFYLSVLMVAHMAVDWGSVPQWITAIVAVTAVGVAAIGIAVQKNVARKRAAVDFFIKTEMDKHLLDAYDEFWDGIKRMNTMALIDFATAEDKDIQKYYFAVRKYLNVHELIAVGLKNGMFDNQTCYDFWCDVLIRGVDASRPLIDLLRQRPGHEETYSELDRLYDSWKAMESAGPRQAARSPSV